jgi:hypothetical protein
MPSRRSSKKRPSKQVDPSLKLHNVIFSYIQKTNVVITFFSLVVGILLFPFSVWTSLPLLVLLCAALFSLQKFKATRSKVTARQWLTTAIGIMISALLWSVFSPLVSFWTTTYVISLPGKNNPLDAAIYSINVSHGGSALRVVSLTDPLRKWLLAFIDKANFFNIRVMSVQEVGDELFLVPPLKTSHIQITPTASASTVEVSQLLNFFTLAPDLDLSIDKTTGNMSQSSGWDLGVAHSISLNYLADPGLPLWQAVNCGQVISKGEIEYAALLDYALTEASLGRIVSALSSLFKAGRIAPSEIEVVRLTTLIAHWSFHRFAGSLGELQSVAYYREATETLKKSIEKDETVKSKHAWLVVIWARRKLSNIMLHNERIFRNELDALRRFLPQEQDAILDLSGDPTQQGTWEDFKRAISNFNSNVPEARGIFEEYALQLLSISPKEFAHESFRAAQHSASARLFFEHGLLQLFRTVRSSKEEKDLVVTSLEKCLEASGASWRTPYTNLFVKLRALLARDVTSETWKSLSSEFEILTLPQSAGLTRRLDENPKWRPSFIPTPPSTDWWTDSFIDWFIYTEIATMSLPGQDDTSVERKRLLDMHLLTRDNGGTGIVFVPGLAIATLLAEHGGLAKLTAEFKPQFKSIVGHDPRDYFQNYLSRNRRDSKTLED